LNLKRLERYFDYSTKDVNYTLNICPSHQLVYAATPKTGCTTIKVALQIAEKQGLLNVYQSISHIGDIHNPVNSPLLFPDTINSHPKSYLEGKSFWRFCSARNPYSRILSCYLDKIVNDTRERETAFFKLGFASDATPTLLDFLSRIDGQNVVDMDTHWMPQSILTGREKINYDYVFYFENFKNNLGKLLNRLRLDEGLFNSI